VVVPVRDAAGAIVGVLDVDSEKPDAFSQADVDGLTKIAAMVYGNPAA
jgi:L-methionine (R)-S-oxide reductase